MISPALRYAKPFNLLPTPAGAVLWLPGQDDAYSATIRDRSGKGNHGTITGALWKRLPSGLWYLDFDGTDDNVNCGSAASLDFGAASFLAMGWFRVDQLSTIKTKYQQFIDKSDQNTLGWHFEHSKYTDKIRFRVARTTGADYVAIESDAIFTAGVIRHVAGIYDHATTTSYIVINGVAQAATGAITGGAVEASAYNLGIGGAPAIGATHSPLDGIAALPDAITGLGYAAALAMVQNRYRQERSLIGV